MALDQAAAYIALVAVSLSLGYWAGTRGSRSSIGSAKQVQREGKNTQRSKDTGSKVAESDSSDEELPDEELNAVKPNQADECKLVLVVRTDLGMSSGKIAAQCSHATLACYKALSKSNPSLLRHWEKTGQTKVALRANDEEELDTLEAMARSLNLCARSIHDAGRTQIAAGSRTVLGIGPGPTKLVNQVTGKLRLL